MKTYMEDILKGTAMEEAQIFTTASKTNNPSKQQKVIKKSITKKTAKPTSLILAAPKYFKPSPPGKKNRRGKDYASIRISKIHTSALKMLFDEVELTYMIDLVLCDFLNRNYAMLKERYCLANPFKDFNHEK